MTLHEAVETALKQNPDIFLAHMEEDKARAAIRVAREPFIPRVVFGSGLAYSDGFPMSIEGSAPSIVQGHATATLFNRPQHFVIAQAREDARGASIAVVSKRDEVGYQTTMLYLDAVRAARLLDLARKALESQQAVLQTVRAQVAEGRALPLAQKQAELAVARAEQLIGNLEDSQADAETSLALALGFPALDQVHPVDQDRAAPATPLTEEEAIQSAMNSHPAIRQLQSQLMSKELERHGELAARLPRVDLVAQYGMLARFNNYDEFFRKFQRNNVQLGVSFQLPVFSPGVGAQVSQTDADLNHLRVELSRAKNRVTADILQAYREVKKAQSATNVARLDLEVSRAQLDVDLAQQQEGRILMRQVDEARIQENDKWIAFYDAQYALEKARWGVLRVSGSLLTAILQTPRK